MPNIVPGAIWTPVDVGNRVARQKGVGSYETAFEA